MLSLVGEEPLGEIRMCLFSNFESYFHVIKWIMQLKKKTYCFDGESNPGQTRCRRVFYHQNTFMSTIYYFPKWICYAHVCCVEWKLFTLILRITNFCVCACVCVCVYVCLFVRECVFFCLCGCVCVNVGVRWLGVCVLVAVYISQFVCFGSSPFGQVYRFV